MVTNAAYEYRNCNPIEMALYELLSYLDFGDTVTMNYAKMRRDLKPNLKLPFDKLPGEQYEEDIPSDPISFEKFYQSDEPFNKITQLLFDGLGAARPNTHLYSAMERAGAMFFSHVRGSEHLSNKPDYGSASEFSDDLSVYSDSDSSSNADTESDDSIHFCHTKLRACSGMKAIVLAQYGSLFYLRQNGAKAVQQDIQQMYYEVEDALKMVKDSAPVANNVRGKLEKSSILHFDLNHCNASNSPDNISLKEKLDDFKPTIVILDYTSSTMAEIRKAQKMCLSRDNIELIIFVDSGLKNNQAGQDFNPYGELRVIAHNKKIRNTVLGAMKLGLSEKDKLPQHTHELVRACKNRGFATSFLGLFKTQEERFQAVHKTAVFSR